MSLTTNCESISNELIDEIKLFYPDFLQSPLEISHYYQSEKCSITIADKKYEYNAEQVIANKRQFKIFNKLCIYKALVAFTDRQMPFGSLTGIRPTRLAYDMLFGGASILDIPSLLESQYLVSKEKAELTGRIVKNQSGYLGDKKKDILFYVHIPFCKSICSYCAFTTVPTKNKEELIKSYCKKLVEEINDAKKIVKDLGKNIYAAYIGGGTPTAIDDQSLEYILKSLDFGDIEFTCEAGRPDTITRTKIELMQRYGVNRLCINPQTLNDITLKTIGRSHTAGEFFECFNACKTTKMDINVDLIAGLPNEGFDEFANSLKGVIDLEPQNITVHTLALKNGAELKNNNYEHQVSKDIASITDYAFEQLVSRFYEPYYLYRQKYVAQNLENVGYALKGKECVYNIASMEESLPVIASGAGGISKMLYSGGRIERLANLRDVTLYIEQAEQRLAKKREFFLQKHE